MAAPVLAYENFGHSETQRVERGGGVRWTIKDGIVYDVLALLASVARMAEEARAREPAP